MRHRGKKLCGATRAGYWISGSRVSLESIIFVFLDGFPPETIVAECLPTLSLEQVHGASEPEEWENCIRSLPL